jgi:hypothetical protein
MNEKQLEKLLSLLTLLGGIASLVLVCYWYVGAIVAAVTIVLGIYTWKRFGRNGLVVAGILCAAFFAVFFLILVMGMGIYYNMIDLKK